MQHLEESSVKVTKSFAPAVDSVCSPQTSLWINCSLRLERIWLVCFSRQLALHTGFTEGSFFLFIPFKCPLQLSPSFISHLQYFFFRNSLFAECLSQSVLSAYPTPLLESDSLLSGTTGVNLHYVLDATCSFIWCANILPAFSPCS